MIAAACIVGMLVCLLVASRRDKRELIRDVRRALDGETEESLVRRRCREPETVEFVPVYCSGSIPPRLAHDFAMEANVYALRLEFEALTAGTPTEECIYRHGQRAALDLYKAYRREFFVAAEATA